MLEERGHAGQTVMLALGSSDVVSTIVLPPSRKALKRTAMAFLIEPALPWSIEDSVIDYERVGTERVFVVAAEAAPLSELIAALQERGIPVASVVPLARMVLEQHLEASPSLAPRYALAWGQAETIDLWLIEQDRPILWQWIPQQSASVVRALRQIALCDGEEFLLVGRNLPDGFLRSLGELTGLETRAAPPLDSEDPQECGARQAAAILGGRRDSPIELCRDQLAPADRHRSIRRELRLLLGNVFLVLLMAILGLAARDLKGERIEEAWCAEGETREAGLFQNLFPKEKVPVAIRGRFESELARLKGVRGESTDLPQLAPYLDVLERLFQEAAARFLAVPAPGSSHRERPALSRRPGAGPWRCRPNRGRIAHGRLGGRFAQYASPGK